MKKIWLGCFSFKWFILIVDKSWKKSSKIFKHLGLTVSRAKNRKETRGNTWLKNLPRNSPELHVDVPRSTWNNGFLSGHRSTVKQVIKNVENITQKTTLLKTRSMLLDGDTGFVVIKHHQRRFPVVLLLIDFSMFFHDFCISIERNQITKALITACLHSNQQHPLQTQSHLHQRALL